MNAELYVLIAIVLILLGFGGGYTVEKWHRDASDARTAAATQKLIDIHVQTAAADHARQVALNEGLINDYEKKLAAAHSASDDLAARLFAATHARHSCTLSPPGTSAPRVPESPREPSGDGGFAQAAQQATAHVFEACDHDAAKLIGIDLWSASQTKH